MRSIAVERAIDRSRSRRRNDAEGSDSRIPSFARARVRAFAHALAHSRVHSSEGDDDGRLCRGVVSWVVYPWYMTQCVVYGNEYSYISKIRVTKPLVCDPVRRIRARISLCVRTDAKIRV